jgi:hypothetical protein
MANEPVKSVFGAKAAMVNPEALASAMAVSAATGPQRPDGDFINFTGKRGVYEIGTEKRDADPDELWVVNVASFEDGYVCWKGGQPMATRLYPMGTAIPALDRSEHGPFPKDGDGWSEAKAMTIRSVDTGQQGYFKINSVSGVSEFANLQREVLARIRGGEAYWPVIKLGKEQFTAKGFKNFKPILEIDGWLSDEAVTALAEAMDSEDETVEVEMEALYQMSGKPAPVQIEKQTVGRKRRV